MPRGGDGGLDFSPLVTHFVFLFTFVLAFAGWWAAFIGLAIATAKYGNGGVGPLWFGIFLELFLILGVAYTLATDSIGMHRLQIAAFGAVALVHTVAGTNGLYANLMSVQAYGAGFLLLTVSNIVWLLYFTSEEDSRIFLIINQIGGGTAGLTAPSRNRRRNPSVHTAASNGPAVRQSKLGGYGSGIGMGMGQNSYGGGPIGGYASGGGFDDPAKAEVGIAGTNTPKAGSFVGGAAATDTRSNRSTNAPASITGGQSPHSPLMQPGNTMSTSTADANTSGQALTSGVEDVGYAYKARALYAYSASADDPNEISFAKGEILDIVDNSGKWWQARKGDGTTGIAPSNYLQII